MRDLTKMAAWAAPLLLCALAAPPQAEAQTMLTVQGGATFASLEGDDVPDEFGTRTGFNFGASIGFPISEIMYLTPGLYYVQKGAEAEENGFQQALELSYLEIPLLLQVMLTGPQRPLGLSVFAGPSLAFEIGCDVTAEFGEGGETVSCDDQGVDTSSMDIGLLFGGGVSFPVAERIALMVNGGLDLGLTSIVDEGDEDLKNSVFFLNVGLGFPLGR